MLGTDFRSRNLRGSSVKKVQIDKNPKTYIGRRTTIDLGLVGDIKSTVTALLPAVRENGHGFPR